MDEIEAIEELLVETARKCLRVIVERDLTTSQNRALAKWMFGCMNQRLNLRGRIESRGPAELLKILKFVDLVTKDLVEIADAAQ